MLDLLTNKCNWTFGRVSLPDANLRASSRLIYDYLRSKPFRQRCGYRKSRMIPMGDIAVLFHGISLERWSQAFIQAILIDRFCGEFDSSVKAVGKYSQNAESAYTLSHHWQCEANETVWDCELLPDGSSTIVWTFTSIELDSEVGSEDWENEWRTVARVMGASNVLVEEAFEKLKYPELPTVDRISYLPHDPDTRLYTSFAPGPPFPVSLALGFPPKQTDQVIAEFQRLQQDTYARRANPTTRELRILASSEDSKFYTEDFELPRMWTYVSYDPDDDSPKYSAFSAKLAESNLPVAIPIYGMTALKDEIEIAVALINAVHIGSPSHDLCLEIQTQQGPELLNDLAQACGFEVDIWSGDAESRWGWFD